MRPAFRPAWATASSPSMARFPPWPAPSAPRASLRPSPASARWRTSWRWFEVRASPLQFLAELDQRHRPPRCAHLALVDDVAEHVPGLLLGLMGGVGAVQVVRPAAFRPADQAPGPG